MKPLTVAIPTFNRASLLEQQLAWLACAIKGFESEVDIIISDNSSPDVTQGVITRWSEVLGEVSLQVNRHPTNIGATGNIAFCIASARTKYIWTISDDDTISIGALPYVLRTVEKEPELALLVLNASGRNVITDEVISERAYPFADGCVKHDGRETIQRCLEHDYGNSIGLMTAVVYRTDLAQAALRAWPTGTSNLAVQIYWSAFCAANGRTLLTRDVFLECAVGAHYFSSNPRIGFKLDCLDRCEVFARLIELGFPASYCFRLIVATLRRCRRGLAKGMVTWGGMTINGLARVAVAFARARLYGESAISRGKAWL